jgi:hypothetical protein
MIAFCELFAGFDTIYSVLYVLHQKCRNLGVYTTQSLQREGNYGHFLYKSTNGRSLRAVGLVSTLNRACTMFCASNAVIWAFVRRTLSNGKEITVILRQNRRTIAFYELFAGFDALYSVHYVLRLKCSKLGVCTSNSLQRKGNYGHFLSKSTNCRDLRVVGLVSTLNRACTMFCA